MSEAASENLQSDGAKALWVCPHCGADGPRERGTHSCSCGRKFIASSVGNTYPQTMMGYQAADGDEYVASLPPRKPIRHRELLNRGRYRLTLFVNSLVLARTDPLPNGRNDLVSAARPLERQQGPASALPRSPAPSAAPLTASARSRGAPALL